MQTRSKVITITIIMGHECKGWTFWEKVNQQEEGKGRKGK
jgi:hypothetical protein